MRPEDKGVKVGNISTYEHASDTFLNERAAQIRNSIRHPHLTNSEFTQIVGSQVAFTSAAAGWSIWNALDKGLHWLGQHSIKAAEYLTINGGDINFMRNEAKYRDTLTSISNNLADFLHGDKQTVEEGMRVLDRMIAEPAELGHTGGRDDLIKLKGELKDITDVNAFKERFKAGLKDVHQADKQRHLGKYFLFWDDMDREAKRFAPEKPRTIKGKLGRTISNFFEWGTRQQSARSLAENSQYKILDDIIESGRKDNRRIVRKFNMMTTIPVTTAVAAFVGWKTFKGANKQKLLDLEAEASYIERLLNEREQQRAESHTHGTTPLGAPSSHIHSASATHQPLQSGAAIASHAAQTL